MYFVVLYALFKKSRPGVKSINYITVRCIRESVFCV